MEDKTPRGNRRQPKLAVKCSLLILIWLPFLWLYYSCRNVELLTATDNNNTTRMRSLIALGANPNWRDGNGNTLLVQEASKLSPEAAAILIGHGVRVDDHNSSGVTALLVAASANNTALVRFLIQRGANVNQTGITGSTALMLAARRGADTARVLLANGADPSPHNDRGDTALSIAQKFHAETIIRLLEEAAAPKAKLTLTSGSLPRRRKGNDRHADNP